MLAPPLAGAIACYIGGVLWLYEKPIAGRWALCLIALLALAGAWLSPRPLGSTTAAHVLFDADVVTGGLVLGTTMAAMFLGHWYLNSPTMALAPLRRLMWIMGAAIAVRAVTCGLGLALELQAAAWPSQEAAAVYPAPLAVGHFRRRRA